MTEDIQGGFKNFKISVPSLSLFVVPTVRMYEDFIGFPIFLGIVSIVKLERYSLLYQDHKI